MNKVFYFFFLLSQSIFSSGICALNPAVLVTPSRFDILAKYMYAKYKAENIVCAWGKEVYVNHLKVWNNFQERWPVKQCEHDYLVAFDQLLDSIRSRGYEPAVVLPLYTDTTLIPIDPNGNICDGAHRVAACLVYKKPVLCKRVSRRAEFASAIYLQQRTKFVPEGLSRVYLDSMALEYCKLKPNAHIVVVFPSAQGNDDQIEAILNEHGKVVYKKEVTITHHGAVMLMKHMYLEEPWSGRWNHNYKGVTKKVQHCYPPHCDVRNNTRVYLYECENVSIMLTCKARIRELFGLGNHSIHSTDTPQEALSLAQIFFVNNSIHFLNHATRQPYRNFDLFVRQYGALVEQSLIDPDWFCIDGSAVLAAYGLRDCADLDYVHHGKRLGLDCKDISSHNDEAKYHKCHVDELIFNPNNFFYYRGLKFVSLQRLKLMKQIRGEAKDKRDVSLIETIQ